MNCWTEVLTKFSGIISGLTLDSSASFPFHFYVPGFLRVSLCLAPWKGSLPFSAPQWGLQGLASTRALLSTFPPWGSRLWASSDQYLGDCQPTSPLTFTRSPVSTPALAVPLHSALYIVSHCHLKLTLPKVSSLALHPTLASFPLSAVLAPPHSVFEYNHRAVHLGSQSLGVGM